MLKVPWVVLLFGNAFDHCRGQQCSLNENTEKVCEGRENMPLDIYKARTISVMERCRTSQYLVSPGRMFLEVKFREFAAPKMGLFIFLIAGATESTEWTVQLEVAQVLVGTFWVSFLFLKYTIFTIEMQLGPLMSQFGGTI